MYKESTREVIDSIFSVFRRFNSILLSIENNGACAIVSTDNFQDYMEFFTELTKADISVADVWVSDQSRYCAEITLLPEHAAA